MNTEENDLVATRNSFKVGSGKLIWKEEFLLRDNGSCSGSVGMTMKWEGELTDNGSKTYVMDGNDNVSASVLDLTWNKVLLSFDNLSLVDKFKAHNESHLCDESYWSGVERDVTQCKFGIQVKPEEILFFMSVIIILKLKSDTYTNKFWCIVLVENQKITSFIRV